MCSTTSATTEALATVGEPTVTLPSLLTKRTRSKVNGCPASTARRSTSKVSPAATRYCLLPVSNIAYINLPAKRGRYKTIGSGRCQQTFLTGLHDFISRRSSNRFFPLRTGIALEIISSVEQDDFANLDWSQRVRVVRNCDIQRTTGHGGPHRK